MREIFFLCIHPSDLLLLEKYIDFLIKKGFISTDDKLNLIYCSNFLNLSKLKNRKNSNYKYNFQKRFNLEFFDNGNQTKFLNEIRNNNPFKIFQKIIKLNKNISKIFSQNSKLFVGAEACASLFTRSIIKYFKKNVSDEIFYFGIDQQFKDNSLKISFIANIFSNLYYILKVVKVCCYENKNGIITQKIIVDKCFKKYFILCNLDKQKGNKIYFSVVNKKKIKKKYIFFIDRGTNFLTWHPGVSKVDYIYKLNSILKIISEKNKNKYELIFKPHPRQSSVEYNLYSFKNKYGSDHLERLLISKYKEIKCLIGVTSSGLKISSIMGIKTYTVKNILLQKNKRTDLRLLRNNNIFPINSLDEVKNI